MSTQYIYSFNEGNKNMAAKLGGKGANLAEMTQLGLPVPAGFTITTDACIRYLNKDQQLWDSLKEDIKHHIQLVEQDLGKEFASVSNPLLFSVRSGAAISMPGMMDTVLNLGLNDETVKGLALSTNNERFALDSYRRFIQMFGDVVKGVSSDKFEKALETVKKEANATEDSELHINHLNTLIDEYKKIYENEVGCPFPTDPFDQLFQTVESIFKSWNNERARIYRNLHDIPHDLGTAVNVQSMVYGNMGDTSGTGVAFTRNPATGENDLYGEYLINAQGEDVVAGVRTPKDIHGLKEQMPDLYDEFKHIATKLETHYKNMQDIEFTIENGRLFILQTRNGKRTAQAAINIAVDMYDEKLISKEEALMLVDPHTLIQLLHPTFDEKVLENVPVLAKGLAASPGAVSGKIYFHSEDSVVASESGEKVIIVRQVTSPEDLAGMVAAEGILTAQGGMTSHAAVVSRGMGKCCVAGASQLLIDDELKTMRIGNRTFYEGDVISLDGSTGCVYEGALPCVEPTFTGKFKQFMDWVDEVRTLGVRANADTPKDTAAALNFGADGVGLCRTEHMFFNDERITAVREMILAHSLEERETALAKLLPFQEEDFYGMFLELDDLPITIRLLDPPLHEFLPHTEEETMQLAKHLGKSTDEVRDRMITLHEVNPMLGHRGCRLAVTYPEIYRMQTRAIIQAAIRAQAKGIDVKPEIMIPLVMDVKELKYVKDHVIAEAEMVLSEQNKEVEYHVGAMIEVPRAALLSNEIAEESDFFSFGTNDLSQMTFGFSRDDAGKFLAEYEEKGIIERSPFGAIDEHGVGELLQMSINRARSTKADLKCGICGEDGGDPASIAFFDKIGYTYVSCSPFRIPVARLAAAQSAVTNKNHN
ncbi:pyruvate, phosphate dikinase [Allofustis seminis]|uniref:pyruvate, phosphate dikinase n=1 Tax=Allofustis seminis TaxID=166939 RepID=UPI00036E28D8|nr:pyruvate, phosphate dikinase [Allofustis seminis]